MEGDSFINLKKVRLEVLQEKLKSGMREFQTEPRTQRTNVKLEKPLLETLLSLIEKETERKVIKIETISNQTCPSCESDVNGKYCSRCGQRLLY